MPNYKLVQLAVAALLVSSGAQAFRVNPTQVNEEGGHLTFSYDEFEPIGPSKWKNIVQSCGGNIQSPIALKTDEALVMASDNPFVFSGLENIPVSMTLENDGHSAKFTPTYNSADLPRAIGGPLRESYAVAQFHFHWGLTSTRGSEHVLNDKRFPLEMHVVMYNEKYGSFAEASVAGWDGLAVVAFFFEIGSPERQMLLSQFLSGVKEPASAMEILEGSFSLAELIGNVKWEILSYTGGLTTPPCSEVVTWIVNTAPIVVDRVELEAFRELKFPNRDPLGDNFRPIQSTNGRQVFMFQ
jgi:carbonic anhydrase